MISYLKYLSYVTPSILSFQSSDQDATEQRTLVHTSSHTKHKNKMTAIDIIPQKTSDNQIPKLITQKITLQDDDQILSPKTITK